jgi:hypothetical protein
MLSAFKLIIIMLTIIMLTIIMLTIILLTISMLSFVMLTAIMLSILKLTVVMLSVIMSTIPMLSAHYKIVLICQYKLNCLIIVGANVHKKFDNFRSSPSNVRLGLKSLQVQKHRTLLG